MPIRVLLADEHTLIRVGMASVINQEADLTVVAQASNGREVVELHRERPPLRHRELCAHEARSGRNRASAPELPLLRRPARGL
jgi:hypothetical protein